MLSQKELKRLVFQQKEKLTDDEIFTSKEYATLLTAQKNGVAGYDADGSTTIFVDDPSRIAYTEGRNCFINYASEFVEALDDRTDKHFLMCGLNLHECGHLLFTDFVLMGKTENFLKKGNLYPSPYANEFQHEIEEFLLTETGASLIGIYHSLDNCIEDGFVDRAVMQTARGFAHCLRLVLEIDKSFGYDYKAIKDQRSDPEAFLMLVLNFARHGDVSIADEDMQDEIVQSFLKIKPFIEKAIFEYNAIERKKLVNTVFCYLFHYLKEMNDREKGGNQSSGDNNQSSGNAGAEQSSSNQQSPQNQQSSENQQQSSDGNSSEQKGSDSSEAGNTSQDGSSSEKSSNGNAGSDGGKSQSLKEVLEKLGAGAPKDGTERIKTPTMPDRKAVQLAQSEASEKGKTEHGLKKSEPPLTSPELEKVAEQIAQSQIGGEQEKAIKSEMECDIKCFMDGVQEHKGVGCHIHRSQPTTVGSNAYHANRKELDAIVRRFMEEFMREIKDRQIGDNMTGLYFGKRLEVNQLYRHDKKVMSRKILPEDIPDMAIGILVDNSGSMQGKKLDVSIKAAYITYKFCQNLKIPCFVMGHSTSGSSVELFSYVDEHSVDGKDAERLFSMTTHNCNRDGYALRYCLNKLERIPAKDKIMFIASDGRPNHNGYGKESGREDCQRVVAEFLKKGIYTIVSSVDDAKEVQYVYKEGASQRGSADFLDLTELRKMPKAFVKILKQRLL